MANEFYNPSGFPFPNEPGDSASARGEFTSIGVGFNKMPAVAGHALQVVRINAPATAMESVDPGSMIDAATAKTAPADADEIPLADSAASFVLKKITWANIKAAMHTYLAALTDTWALSTTGNAATATNATNVTSTINSAVNATTQPQGSTGTQVATLDFVIQGQSLPAEGRLTLTTATPVTTGDITAATTLYYTPYKGTRIALYNTVASKWELYQTAEISIAIPAAASQMYDVFAYDNASTPALELLAWTNDTTRATALALQDGVYVKSTDHTRRFLGCVRTTTVAGQTEDSAAKRYVWNMYNRVVRKLKRFETTSSWTYTTAAWRQANGSALNQLDFIRGLDEDAVIANANHCITNTSVCGVATAIGLDAITVSPDCVNSAVTAPASSFVNLTSVYDGMPGLGRHILTWLEFSQAVGTTTWYGVQAAGANPSIQTGIVGSMLG